MDKYLLAAFYLTGLLSGYALILLAGTIADRRIRLNGLSADVAGSTEFAADRSFPKNLILSNLNAFAWMITFARHDISIRSAFILTAMSFALIIASTDLKTRLIPNSLIITLLGAGILASSLDVFGYTLRSHLIGLAIGALMFAIPYLIGSQIGAGDVKYTGAVGFFLGYPGILYAAIFLSIVLVVWIAIMSVARRNVMKKSIALAPFISVAFAATLLLYI
ncbi:MAG: prepilin peptidase [Saccharofermentanales bacterium]